MGSLAPDQETRMLSRTIALSALALACLLAGCAGADYSHPGPPHPGAVNPYSHGGFGDAGPNYPNTGR